MAAGYNSSRLGDFPHHIGLRAWSGRFAGYISHAPAKVSSAYGFNDKEHLRKEIVRTANQFIGVRYRWGGQSSGTGFDCSGLTMAVYSLNGLDR